MTNKKSERLTSEEFARLVRETPDSQLESELNITTSNMEILLGTGNPEENKQKVFDFFRKLPYWEDYKQFWIDQSKNAYSSPEDREIASVRAKQEHFKNKEGYIGASISINQNKFGLEGGYTTDISFYDLENNPINESEKKKRVIADTFCKLMQFAQENNLQYVVKHSVHTYTGNRGYLVHWEPTNSNQNTNLLLEKLLCNL